MSNGTLPDFIIAGAYPGGTGQLYSFLLQHPRVYLPLPMAPECNFFVKTKDYERGLGFYSEKFFASAPAASVKGERSSLAFTKLGTAERISRNLPNIKLIILLRDPVERAYAHYRFTVLCGFEDKGFEEALTLEEQRRAALCEYPWIDLEVHDYFRKGCYDLFLKDYLEHFRKEQLFFMRSDELGKQPALALKKICDFLEIENSVEFRAVSEFRSPAVKDPKRQQQLRTTYGAALDSAIQRKREELPPETECDRELARNLVDTPPAMDAKLRADLQKRYAPHLKNFAALWPLDVSSWLESA